MDPLITRWWLTTGYSKRVKCERRGGSIVFQVPGFEAVQGELARRNVICDARPDAGIRFGPHFFNTDDELRFAVDQVVEIVATGAHLEGAHATAGY